MLGSAALIAFAATARPDAARHFYQDVLGLRLVADSPFALVFDAAGTMLRIAKVPDLTPQSHTIVGWSVDDIEAAMASLGASGVAFEIYEGMTDRAGVWSTPDGSRVAWFKDPDGNLLSLTAFPT